MRPQFTIGDKVQIRHACPPGHVRTPYFIRGKIGEIIRILGEFANPEELAYGRDGKPFQPIYSIKFLQDDLWSNYSGQLKDTAIVEVRENWLEKQNAYRKISRTNDHGLKHIHSDYDFMHKHQRLFDTDDITLTRHMVMTKAVEQLLIEKDLFSADELREMIEKIDTQSPIEGARMVARAWIDPDFKARMLKDVNATAKEMDIDAGPIQILAVENTAVLHNAIVCTLCSCYPKFLIGLPPDWYKSRHYRSRMIIEPRVVLAEFGTKISDNVEVRVYDSTTEIRYMVLPMPPENIGELNEETLSSIVTRDSMIGTSFIKPYQFD